MDVVGIGNPQCFPQAANSLSPRSPFPKVCNILLWKLVVNQASSLKCPHNWFFILWSSYWFIFSNCNYVENAYVRNKWFKIYAYIFKNYFSYWVYFYLLYSLCQLENKRSCNGTKFYVSMLLLNYEYLVEYI